MIRATTILACVAAAAWAQSATPKQTAARRAATPSTVSSYKDLKFPELRPVTFPQADAITLPNGMRLYLLENHELPLVNGTILVRTGTLFDPPDKVGLSALAGQGLIEGGIERLPGDAMLRKLQNFGAQIDGTVSENCLTISFLSLKESSGEVLDLMKDAVIAPVYQQDRIDFAKARLRNAIAHRNDEAAVVLNREFRAAVYGKKSPYAAEIEYADLDRINRADLAAFHDRYFFPANVILAMEGDFDAARMKANLETLFAGWTNDQAAVPEFPKLAEGGTGRYLAARKDMAQTLFSTGQLASDFLDKDGPALQIMSDILGRAPQGRINRRLHSLTDNVSANWSAGYGHPGIFEITGSVNGFRLNQALKDVEDEIKAIRTSEVSEEELKTAKGAALNSFVFQFDKQLSVMPRLSLYEYFGFPKNYTAEYQKALESVSRADVLRVARQHLDPAKFATVIVGNPDSFDKPLESLGLPVTAIDLTIAPPKVEATVGDAVMQKRGKDVLARMQQAMGGVDKLAAVADYTQEAVYQFAAPGRTEASMKERWIGPDHLRQDTVLGNGKVSVYSDGKSGWMSASQGYGLLAGVQLKQVQSDMFRILFPLLLSDRNTARKVNALDENTVEISDPSGQVAKVVVDPKTGLLKDVLYEAITASGQMSVIDSYSDYRDVSGLKLPFKVTIMVAGQKLQDIAVKSIQLNGGLQVTDLEKRQ